MIRRNAVRCLMSASLVALAAAPAPAFAQHIDRIVAFGDSYADDGNLFQIVGITPPIVYSTGRFSGGTNYIDTLSDILNVPVDNFAIAGALTNNTNTNTPGLPPAPQLPGFITEWNAFLAGGGGVFPTVDGTFDEHDLVTVSIGGNDARTYQTGNAALGILPGTLAGAPTAGAVSAATAAVGLDALVAAGAPTISFLAVNTALAPEVAGLPDPAAAAAIRDAYSTSFNSTIQQTLAGYAADGVTVHYLDLALIGERVAADPEAFGLTSAGACPPAQALQCVADRNVANQYLFYVDNLHLSSQGFAIVAQYVAVQLQAPLTLQGPSDAGLELARQFGRTLSTRSDLYSRGPVPAGTRFFAIADTYSRDFGETDSNDRFDIDGVGGTLGAEFGLGGGMVGIAANYTHPRVRFGGESTRIKGHSWQIGAYGGMSSGSLFGQAYVGYGKDEHKITRPGVIDDMTARPDGNHVVAGAKGGYLMPMGGARIGPIVAIDYARAKVDSYTENGDAALTLNVSDQSLKAFTGQLGIEARADLAGVRPYVALAAEHQFSGNSRLIHFAQTSAPTIVNEWNIDGEKETYARASGGMSADLWAGATIDAAVSASFGRNNGDDLGGQLGVKFAF